MFMLLAIPVGVALGLAIGGRLAALSSLRLRWAWLMVAGLVVQAVLFTSLGDAIPGELARAIYVGSTAAVLVAVLANQRVVGMPLVAAGAVSNLVAIVANGGAMPADPAALVAAGLEPIDHANSVVDAEPALRVLTDIFAIPAGVPFANVFSIGDVLIGVGVAIVIAAAMRRRGPFGTGDAAP